MMCYSHKESVSVFEEDVLSCFKGLSKTQRLYLESKGVDVDKLISNPLVSGKYGFQFSDSSDALLEFSNLISGFMNKFNIGKHLSGKKWSDSAKDKIRSGLKQVFDDFSNQPTSNPMDVYDSLRSKVADKYSSNDVAVVARTEGAKLRGALQLVNWLEAGVEEVIYVARPGARKSHALRNNRVYKIKDLLENEEDRIPISVNGVFDGYNCRCFYRPKIAGFTPSPRRS